MIVRDWSDVFVVAAMLLGSGMLGLTIGRHGWHRRKCPSTADRLLADYDEPVEHKAKRPPAPPARRGVVYLEFEVHQVVLDLVLPGQTQRYRGWHGVTVLTETDRLYQVRYDEPQLQEAIGVSKWVDKSRVQLIRPLPDPHETQAADALLRQALGEEG